MSSTLLRQFACLIVACGLAFGAEPFEIKAGDRVVLIGDTLFEREGVAAALESRLYQRWAPRAFSVRNLSFAADRPDGVSRASFDPPGAGFKRIQEQLALVKPNVAIIGYGMAAALEELTYKTNDWTLNPDVARYGSDFTAARFQKDLNQLVEAITTANGGPVRLVFVAPIRPEDLRSQRPQLPSPKALTDILAGYHAAIAAVAKERGGRFVDTPALTPATETLTFNSIHPSDAGLERWADLVAGDLGWASGGEQKWGAAQTTALRAALARKNDLFFHRWRPANHTYIFGFRKHEQGKNAAEMPQFDELLVTADAAIAAIAAGGEAPPLPAKKAEAPVDTAAPDPAFKLGENISAQLWAANPLISKPLHLNWDARGRLWVASTPIYPQIEPGAIASDRIFVVEDTDRDGKADKSVVFTEDLLIPSTVAPVERADGKLEAYVGASTDLLLLTDTNGDGKADTRRAVLSGFGTEDTHHTVHTLQWGHDGRLYFNQSIYIHTHLETPWGVVRLNAGGVFAYDTHSERVEILIKGLCNTWGHALNDEGQSFFSDGCGSTGITWGFPGGVFVHSEGAKYISPSISKGSYPKFCGLELIKSPLFPADWQGDAITCDFRAHRIVRMGITQLEGKSGYVSNDEPDLLKTPDAWFRPIDVKLGPDGALYLADWTNPVINHGEVDFRDTRRDKVHGRVWRVAPTDSKPLAWTPVAGRTIPELCQALLSANKWERDSARRVLALQLNEAGDQAVRAWYNSLTDQTLQRHAAQELNFAYRSTRRPIWFALPAAALTPAGQALIARAAGPGTPDRKYLQQVQSALKGFPSPRGELELIRALVREPSWDNAKILLRVLSTAPKDDPYMTFAIRSSLDAVAQPLLKALESDGLKALDDSGITDVDLVRVLQFLPAERVGGVANRLLNDAGQNLTGDTWGPLVAYAGDATMVARMFGALKQIAAAKDATLMTKVLRWTGDAAARGVRLTNEEPPLAAFLEDANQGVRSEAIRLAGLWKRADLAPRVRAAASDGAVRKEVLAALLAIGGESAVTELTALLSESTTTSARAEVLGVLAKVDGGKALVAATPFLQAATETNDAAALWRVLWAGNGVIDRVVKDGVPVDLPEAALNAGFNTAQDLGGRGTKLAEKFSAIRPPRPTAVHSGDKPADLPAWMEYTQKNGIASKGEARYFGLNCQICHAIGGAGGKLGPDMSTLGASAPMDYIIESVLNPAAKVKEGYHSVVFRLKDGGLVMGIPGNETDKEIIVRLPGGIEQVVMKDAIAGRDMAPGSLMPPGLTDVMGAEDQAHLFAFLGQLGKPGPFDASDGKVARILRLSGSLPEGTAPDLSKFQPAYANVDGRMTPRAWRAPIAAVEGEGAVYAMAQVEVPTDGLLTITVEGTERPWLDGIRFDPQETGRQVKAGKHTIAVSVNRNNPVKDLRIKVNIGRFVTP